MLIMSLVVLGGLVLLVVCSGINDRVDAPPQPSSGMGIEAQSSIPGSWR
jgi:hypothetical protein